MGLGLGIDTGGTYTDSVIVDLNSGSVLTKAKALTTKSDLVVGIVKSVDKLDHSLFSGIRLISVSSTLATNSVVEGKGCRVALITVGHEFDQSISVDEVAEIRGGHNIRGERKEPLDLDEAMAFVRAVKDKVDGFAVSSYLSVRNPEHEIVLKLAMRSITNLPVVCGHELSSKLGFHERTVTAVLNAKLIPMISDLVDSVKSGLRQHSIVAPLMIVKGDGSLMGEMLAKERPVETILSGPAASLAGAKHLTGEENAIVVDVGGTTTDIGILRNGRPRLDREGALIGGWRTRVKAVDISTSGIGGDSRVFIQNGCIHLSAVRVVPLCIANSMYPILSQKLENIMILKPWSSPTPIELASVNQITEFFIFGRQVKGLELSYEDRLFVDRVGHEPCSVQEISDLTKVHPFSFNVRRLEQLGIVQRIGLTPTDILHASGEYVEYDQRPSKLGVEIQANILEMDQNIFCAKVKEAVINKIATELLKRLIYEETGETAYGRVAWDFIDKFVRHTSGMDFSCRLRINKKIIGIGAPVGAYLPEVASKFHTGLSLPEHMEVGNAIGAITGSVIESVEMLIRPTDGFEIMEDSACVLHSFNEKKEFENIKAALDYAERTGANLVRNRAMLGGADAVEIVVERNDRCAFIGKELGGNVLIGVELIITAIGKPKHLSEASAKE
jgi:N-methylhydantoinase A/oxoprolinase/acetone carboxylase beta subunit